MRIDVLAVLLVTACGGATSRSGTSRAADACAAYTKEMRPPLGRLVRAADRFGAASPEEGAAESRALAESLADAEVELGQVRAAGELGAAHRELLEALAGMTGAVRTLGHVLEARDEARKSEASESLRQASDRWGRAVTRLRGVCPEI